MWRTQSRIVAHSTVAHDQLGAFFLSGASTSAATTSAPLAAINNPVVIRSRSPTATTPAPSLLLLPMPDRPPSFPSRGTRAITHRFPSTAAGGRSSRSYLAGRKKAGLVKLPTGGRFLFSPGGGKPAPG